MNKTLVDKAINIIFIATTLFLFLNFYNQISDWFIKSKGAASFGEITVKESLVYLQIQSFYLVACIIFLATFYFLTSGQGNAIRRIRFIFELMAISLNRMEKNK